MFFLLEEEIDDFERFSEWFNAEAVPKIEAAGGRVLAVTGQGTTLVQARERAYDAVGRISWSGMHNRADIAAHPTGASD